MLRKLINSVTQVILGVGIFDLHEKVKLTNNTLKKAIYLAEHNKRFSDALSLAMEIKESWTNISSLTFLGKWFCDLWLQDSLEQLDKWIAVWQRIISSAKLVLQSANSFLQMDIGDPTDYEYLTKALETYQEYQTIVYAPLISDSIDRISTEIEKRKNFIQLYTRGNNLTENLFFQNAILIYEQALELYESNLIRDKLDFCQQNLHREEDFTKIWQTVKQLCSEGKIALAFQTIQPQVEKFLRREVVLLYQKLEEILQAKSYYRKGIEYENLFQLTSAKSAYMKTLSVIPEYQECKIRLAIVFSKLQKWDETIKQLETLDKSHDNVRINYLLGLAHLHKGNLYKTLELWGKLRVENEEIQNQYNFLQHLIYAEKNKIELAVNSGDLQIAKRISEIYLEQFGEDDIVSYNLHKHINPRIKATAWQSANWEKRKEIYLSECAQDFTINNLHNYAVASYYFVIQLDVDKSSVSQIIELIGAMCTLWANIENDPNLKNTAQLNDLEVDYKIIISKIEQELEGLINTYKEYNLESYFTLYDHYNLEKLALKKGLHSIKNLKISPLCYSRLKKHNSQFPSISLNRNLNDVFYTNWGLAVSVCLQKNWERGAKLKPNNAQNTTEIFAKSIMNYYEACLLLKNGQWRNIFKYKEDIRNTLKCFPDWSDEFTKLCTQIQQNLEEEQDHHSFSQLWFDVINTKESRQYHLNCQVVLIAEKLDNASISDNQALAEARKLLKIDGHHQKLLSLVELVEIRVELEEIRRGMNDNQYDRVHRIAVISRHQEVKTTLARYYIYTILDNINNPHLIQQLRQEARKAYELAPHQPEFIPVYQLFGIVR